MKRSLPFVLLLLSSLTFAAELSDSAKAEISQLLSTLGVSRCEFYRNGSWYGAAEAQAHLTKKYEYLADRGMISSAEQFIADAGTKSSMSGEPYQVRCPGRDPVPSAQWLGSEVKRRRQERAQ